jgi:hypothetical protein
MILDGSMANFSRTHHQVLDHCKDLINRFDNSNSCLISLFAAFLFTTIATPLGKSSQKLLSSENSLKVHQVTVNLLQDYDYTCY